MSLASHGARRSRERPLGGEVVWRTGWSGDARTAGRGGGSGGTLRGPRHGRAGRRAAHHQRVPDPHTSRRRRVVRGLAPHRATRAGATTCNGTASGGCSGRPRPRSAAHADPDSPVEMSRALDKPLATVSHHMRLLRDLGYVELLRTRHAARSSRSSTSGARTPLLCVSGRLPAGGSRTRLRTSSVSCNTSRGRSEGVCAFDGDYLGQFDHPLGHLQRLLRNTRALRTQAHTPEEDARRTGPRVLRDPRDFPDSSGSAPAQIRDDCAVAP